ncbi:hypothetical protein GCM10010412_028210 [Nonomuraea recticatena]|uniref:DNA polymerase III beta sliding clamp C-terminal domain-containing protein n=1 Tax=Nonomuraea recticatena TaxID=46178 RepID=A0ABN3RP87_9ACTN
MLVPAKVLAAAAKAFAGVAEVEISMTGQDEKFGGGLLGLSGGGLSTTTRLLDPQFPNFRALMPKEFEAHADLQAGSFLEAVKRVGLVAERDTPVKLTFADGQVTIEAGTGDEAHGVEVLPVKWTGEPMTIAFNHTFLLEGIAATGSPAARLKVVSEIRPAIVVGLAGDGEPVPGYEYLIMPIRLSS